MPPVTVIYLVTQIESTSAEDLLGCLSTLSLRRGRQTPGLGLCSSDRRAPVLLPQGAGRVKRLVGWGHTKLLDQCDLRLSVGFDYYSDFTRR